MLKFICFIFVSAILCFNSYPQNSLKKAAVTIDDLPFNIASRVTNDEMKMRVSNLLESIKKMNVPAAVFVNENKLERGSILDPERVEILKMWLDAGTELGNHTYAHRGAHNTPLEEYKEGILKGEVITKKLLAEEGK